MFSFIARHKVAFALVFLNVVAVLVVILVIVFHNAKTATIDIYVAPSEAVIELNGKKYDNFQQYDIMPGDYHVKVSMEGMETKEFDFEIFDGEFKRIRTYLLDAEGGFSYYLDRPGEEAILAEVADDELSKKFVEEYERIAGILDILPIEFDTYIDNYAYYIRYSIWQDKDGSCDKIICLTIEDNTGGNEQRAIEKIRNEGFNPDDYGITYVFVPIYAAEMDDE